MLTSLSCFSACRRTNDHHEESSLGPATAPSNVSANPQVAVSTQQTRQSLLGNKESSWTELFPSWFSAPVQAYLAGPYSMEAKEAIHAAAKAGNLNALKEFDGLLNTPRWYPKRKCDLWEMPLYDSGRLGHTDVALYLYRKATYRGEAHERDQLIREAWRSIIPSAKIDTVLELAKSEKDAIHPEQRKAILDFASESGRADLYRHLLETWDADAPSPDARQNALISAISGRDVDTVRYLMDTWDNEQEIDAWSAKTSYEELEIAIEDGSADILRILLEKKTSTKAIFNGFPRYSSLFIFAVHHNAEAVRILAERLGTVDEIKRALLNESGKPTTVTQENAPKGVWRELTRALMIAPGADGYSDLQRKIQAGDLAQLQSWRPLLEAEDFERKTGDGATLFHLCNDPQVIQFLVTTYIELDKQRVTAQPTNIALLTDKFGTEVIFQVAGSGSAKALELLLPLLPSSVTVGGQDQRAALMLMAAELGHVEILKVLLDEKGVALSSFARINLLSGNPSIEPITPFMVACRSGHLEAAKFMLNALQSANEKASTLNEGQEEGFTPLMFARRAGMEPVAEWLIRQSADPLKRDIYGNRADDGMSNKLKAHDEGATASMPTPIVLDEELYQWAREAEKSLLKEHVAG